MGSSKERLRVFAIAPSTTSADGISNTNLFADPAVVAALKKEIEKQIAHPNYPQYFVFDWRRQIMLRFPEEAPSGDIKKDLSKLLRASKIR